MTAKTRAMVDIGKYLLFMAVLAMLFQRGSESLGYNWQWYLVPQYLFSWQGGQLLAGPLLQGLEITFEITGISLVFAFVVGLVTSLLRLSPSFVGRVVARTYLELVRNTPLLIQIFFIYFVLAPVLDMEAMTAAVVALSLFEGAYASEMFRAGILSIADGQWEAAHSLGLSTRDTYLFVILPQAVRRILPPLTGQAVSLIKDSALVSTIAIWDLTMQGQAVVSETFLTFEIWFTVAAIYLVITLSLSTLVHTLERRFPLKS